MRKVIISPHTDDSVFSLGSYILSLQGEHEVVVITPFAGIPSDKEGEYKHITLRREHDKACDFLGCKVINGDFFDDVYPDRDLSGLYDWMRSKLQKKDEIFIPLGIHHPDHVIIRDLFVNSDLPFHHFYAELPYRMLYPHIYDKLTRVMHFNAFKREKTQSCMMIPNDPIKLDAIEKYRSQLIGWDYVSQLCVEEYIW